MSEWYVVAERGDAIRLYGDKDGRPYGSHEEAIDASSDFCHPYRYDFDVLRAVEVRKHLDGQNLKDLEDIEDEIYEHVDHL